MTIIPNSEYILLKGPERQTPLFPSSCVLSIKAGYSQSCKPLRAESQYVIRRKLLKCMNVHTVTHSLFVVCLYPVLCGPTSLYRLISNNNSHVGWVFGQKLSLQRGTAHLSERKLCRGRCLFKHEAPCSSKPYPSHHSLVPLVHSLSVRLPRLFQSPK